MILWPTATGIFKTHFRFTCSFLTNPEDDKPVPENHEEEEEEDEEEDEEDEDEEDDDPDALADPLFRMNMRQYLTEFITEFVRNPYFSNHFAPHLNVLEKKALSNININIEWKLQKKIKSFYAYNFLCFLCSIFGIFPTK